MTPPEFSVLLLAWDDADPGVAVLDGAELPPTLSLVYQLAAQQPVVALYPHLPAPQDEPAPTPAVADAPAAALLPEPADAPAAPAPPAALAPMPLAPTEAPDPLTTPVAGPGVRLLPAAPGARPLRPAPAASVSSRLLGLADLTPPAAPHPLAADASARRAAFSGAASPTTTAAGLPPAALSQWPTGVHAPALAPRGWARPAAPYLGASEREWFAPPPPAPPRSAPLRQAGPPAAPTVAAPVARFSPAPPPASAPSAAELLFPARPQAGDLRFDPDPELPVVHPAAQPDEPTEDIGPAEARDLAAPDNVRLPMAPPAEPIAEPAAEPTPQPAPSPPEAASAGPPPAATPGPEAAPVVALSALDNLNFRMIQYARRAAQLVQGRPEFNVIYAPNWPAWLAAVEIRNRSRLPLVLYAATLAADFAGPAERGWLLEVERMALRRAHLVLVPDQAAQQHLHLRYPETTGKTQVVPAADEDAVLRALAQVAR